MKVTLVPVKWARTGFRFQFQGATPDCQECKLTRACLSLEPGLYRIEAVRSMTHTCPGPFAGPVQVAEVSQTPWEVALAPGPGTLEGATFSLRRDTPHGECELAECAHYDLCHPPGLAARDRLTIQALEDKLTCPLGLVLRKGKVTRAPF